MVLDLWEKIGALDEMDLTSVIAKIFVIYEEKLLKNPNDRDALQFFRALQQVVDQVGECNLNRR
jgi:hypothetical protein